MRAICILLTVFSSIGQGQPEQELAAPRSGPAPTQTAPKRTSDGPTSTTPAPSRARPQQAPDGDRYIPPTSVRQTPKVHDPETNQGRRPGPVQGSNEASWIIGSTAAAGATAALTDWLHVRNQPEHQLSRSGPKMPDHFSMSGFAIGGFCQRDWPVVVDYFLDAGAVLLITVQTAGMPAFTEKIKTTRRRAQVIFRLPQYFPQKPTPGMYTVRAMNEANGSGALVYARLYGLGAGVRAVGSVAIDQVRFSPRSIRPKQKESASYAFHAHTDFDRVRAEFLKAVMVQGQFVSKMEDHDDVNGVQRETTPMRNWNGKKATPGQHILQVRAWESALDQANWVIAWSADQVVVEE